VQQELRVGQAGMSHHLGLRVPLQPAAHLSIAEEGGVVRKFSRGRSEGAHSARPVLLLKQMLGDGEGIGRGPSRVRLCGGPTARSWGSRRACMHTGTTGSLHTVQTTSYTHTHTHTLGT
jgi:hypothetical protein